MTQPTLIVDPGRPSTPRLAVRFMRSEIDMASKRLLRKVGLLKLYELVPQEWALPDSPFAKSAIAYAEQHCPDYMIRHCFRSYCFGAILASRNKLKLDREVFFVAAMLHDLGLSPAHVDDPGSFEWVGAKLAYRFTKDSDQSEAFATTVHNAIALHTCVGIAGKQAPELALLHYGTGMDLFGMRLDEIPRITLEEILVRYPRDHFKEQFCTCLSHQAHIKPDSHIAAAIGIGITDQILEQLAH
jgi:hypothetical protein